MYNAVFPRPFQFPGWSLTPDKENEHPRMWAKLIPGTQSIPFIEEGCHAQQRVMSPLESSLYLSTLSEGHTVLRRPANSTTCHRGLRAAHGVVQKRSNSAGGSRPREPEKKPGGEEPMLTPSGLRLDMSAFCTQHPNHQHLAATCACARKRAHRVGLQ